MPDALLLARDNEYSAQIQDFSDRHNLRLKFTFDPELVQQWLSTKAFDLLILPADIAFDQQQKLAYSLWQLNPGAFLVLFDPEDKQGLSWKKVRLMGAVLATGERYLEQFEKLVLKIEGTKFSNKNDFSIVVVEDLDAARDIICSFVESLGFSKVRGVSSAKEILIDLKNPANKIDCIITDERMPVMAGHELIAQLRSQSAFEDLPIIVLTAHGTQDCLLQSLQVGASGFLVKPPSKSDLLREVARAMRVRSGAEKARLVSPQHAQEMLDLL